MPLRRAPGTRDQGRSHQTLAARLAFAAPTLRFDVATGASWFSPLTGTSPRLHETTTPPHALALDFKALNDTRNVTPRRNVGLHSSSPGIRSRSPLRRIATWCASASEDAVPPMPIDDLDRSRGSSTTAVCSTKRARVYCNPVRPWGSLRFWLTRRPLRYRNTVVSATTAVPDSAVHTPRRIPLVGSRATSLWPLPPWRCANPAHSREAGL
jgi:hypothetical protein